MSNSPLIDCKVISPNKNRPRNHAIDRLTPHCVVGQLSAEAIGSCFAPVSRQASCNYGIGYDGRVALICDEGDRSWCSSSPSNDHRAITIECASDKEHPYAMNSVVYEKLILLCADICRRYGKKKVLWLGSKEAALAYQPKADEMVLTAHRWFAAKACPGDWLYSRYGELAERINQLLGSDAAETTAGWKKENGSWYYYKDGAALKAQWVKDGGHWYWLGEDGAMATGWLSWQGKLYWLNPEQREGVPEGACIVTDGSGAIG